MPSIGKEQTLAVEQQMNWGGIIRGALIVTAAVVGCVAIGYAASTFIGWAAIPGSTSAAIVSTVTSTAQVAWGLVGQAAAGIGTAIVHFGTWMGIAAPINGAIAAAQSGFGWLAGGVTALFAAPHVMHAVMGSELTHTVATADPSPMVGDGGATHHAAMNAPMIDQTSHSNASLAGTEAVHPVHDLSFEAGKHAANHDHKTSWAARVPKAADAAPIQPRDTSHVAQVAADQGNAPKEVAMA